MRNDSFSTPGLEIQDLDRSSMTVKIMADKSTFSHAIGRLKPYKSIPYKMRPALERVADYVRVEMIPRVFKQEGPGWRRLAPRTVMERISQGYSGAHPILVRKGDLFAELTKKSHPRHIEIIKTGKNARIEIGGSSAKFIENQMGVQQQRLPARPMIPGTGHVPLPDRDRQEIARIIMKALRQQLKV